MAAKSIHQKGEQTPEIAVTSVRIEKHKLERLKVIAEKNQRTMARHVRWLIDRELEEHEDKAA